MPNITRASEHNGPFVLRFYSHGWVNIGDIPELDSATAFTLSAWVRPDGDGASYLWLKGSGASQVHVYINSVEGIRAQINSSYGVNSTYPVPLDGEDFAHVVVVYNGAGATNPDKLKVYRNGAEVSLTFTGAIPATTDDLSGGTAFLGVAGSYRGEIKDFRVYTTALDSYAVGLLYSGHDYPLSLSHHYQIDDGSGLTVVDSGSNPMDGTVSSAGTEWVVHEFNTGYCSVADVERVIYGIAQGDDFVDLGSWISSTNRSLWIEDLIGITREDVDHRAGRDFHYHRNVDIFVDGPNTTTFDLGVLGFVPLLDVSSFTVEDYLGEYYEIDVGDVVWYSDGRVANNLAYKFTPGYQNLLMTISWGYVSVPNDVKRAQACLVAAELLKLMSAGDTQDFGFLGGMDRVDYEGLRIVVPTKGRYATAISAFDEMANRILARYRRMSVAGLRPRQQVIPSNTKFVQGS